MKIKLSYIFKDKDRHGNERTYVRRYRNGRKVRIKEPPDTIAFMLGYQAALAALEQPHEHARINGRTITPGSLGALAAKYFDSKEFTGLDRKSKMNRRNIIESCLREKLVENSPLGDLNAKLFNASHMKWLLDAKADTPGAANNRRKYISSMLGWAVQQLPPLVNRNVARDVKKPKPMNGGTGYYTWTDEDVAKFEACYPIGTRERLAMALMLFTGLRRQDAIRLGPSHVRNGNIEIVVLKTKDKAPTKSVKPLLPELAAIIAATPTVGLKTYLVNALGQPFLPNSFGNWFKKVCARAGLDECTPHGLRKAAACRVALAGHSDQELMSLFDWLSPMMATHYTKMADKTRMTQKTIQALARN